MQHPCRLLPGTAFRSGAGRALGLVLTLALAGAPAPAHADDTVYGVEAAVETDPAAQAGDVADDPAIWIHPTNPALSRIISTDKFAGLVVHDLAGNEVQYLTNGRTNNVDLRYQFDLGLKRISYVATTDRDLDAVSFFAIDETTGLLETTSLGDILLPYEPYGLCLYVSEESRRHHVIVNNKAGLFEQWELAHDGAGGIEATKVRSFNVDTQPEGCVADDETGLLFVGEEAQGIWRFGAEPGDGTDRILVDATSGEGTHLTADVEGLTIYYGSGEGGYLLASSQGSNSYVVYDRQPPHDYVMTFAIVAGDDIDGTSTTDGIDVTNFPLGPNFPFGMFVAQDDANDGLNQNFKLVRWEEIAEVVDPPLEVSVIHDPREVGAPPIFTDGFESGSPASWNAIQGY